MSNHVGIVMALSLLLLSAVSFMNRAALVEMQKTYEMQTGLVIEALKREAKLIDHAYRTCQMLDERK